MKINIPAKEELTFYLNSEQGARIRDLIASQITCSFRHYVNEVVGLHISNITSILNGRRKTSISMLRRLLSGTRIELNECQITFILENTHGGIVPVVDSQQIETTSSLLDEKLLETLDPSLDPSSHLPETESFTNRTSEDHPLPPEQSLPQQEPPPTSTPQSQPSSPLVKPLEGLKTALASRSWENQDESSDTSGPDSPSPQTSSSPTPSHADQHNTTSIRKQPHHQPAHTDHQPTDHPPQKN